MKWLFLFFFFTTTVVILAQENVKETIKGKLIDRQTTSAIPFSKIYNKTTQEGTITNDKGYFKIGVSGANDVIFITQIGYKHQNLLYDLKINFQTVYLDVNLQLIDEMIARPRNISYLCQLIQKCRLKENKMENSGKAYYELKSYIDTNQIELVEGFYNYTSIGYDMGNIALKAGRLAIRPDEGRMFMSLESSKALTQLKLFKANNYFPIGPFDMKARLMEKKFYMSLQYKYLLENKDSVYVIDYIPKDTTGNYFEGTIWINKSNEQVLKVTTNCKACATHPFLPIFPIDKILQLDMSITKTFSESNGKMCFNHVDFQYDIAYKSRIRDTNFHYTENQEAKESDSLFKFYTVKTEAVLYSYDQKKQFQLPIFSFANNTDDYRKIDGLPYSSFFWENNNEDRINNEKDKNQLFFSDGSSIGNNELFNTYFYGSEHQGFIFSFKPWSKNRIRFRNISEKENNRPLQVETNSQKYNLVIQLSADINTYNDSTDIITSAVFDPFTSYYKLPMNMATHCFINMYFDLHEIARRDLHRELENNPDKFDETYQEFVSNFEKSKSLYLSQTERGTNEKAMIVWNEFIRQRLSINNINLFNPFPKE
jgi:hypothetical protein